MNGKHVCADALALLSLSLDEDLSSLERYRLERHIRDCPDCRHTGARLEALTRTLRGLPLEAPSISALPHLPWRRRIARTGFPAAAAMIVASFGLVALQGSVDVGSGGTSPTVTVSSAVSLSPITHSLPPQLQSQPASAAIVWLP
jgi:predicted anti-sigma-YlaC factor YlaD